MPQQAVYCPSMAYSPSAMAPKDIDSDYLAEVDEYFSKPYVPLSNLPTPPLSSCSNDEEGKLGEELAFDLELLGPAIHLANMIPQAVSFTTPSVNIVHGMLNRASLPRETIALAVCALDSLSNRFAASWRRSCPGNPTTGSSQSTQPEVIVLAALLLAAKFTEDLDIPTSWYARHIGLDAWTTKQINSTETCILEDLNYRIAPLYQSELLDDALLDMERAATGRNIYSYAESCISDADDEPADSEPCSPGGTVETVTTPGTPKEVPFSLCSLVENMLPAAALDMEKGMREMTIEDDDRADILMPTGTF